MHEEKTLSAEPGTPAIDWALLAFLILFLNVKLPIKAIALLLIFILRPDFRFGFRLPFRRDGQHSRLPLFYPGIILVALWNAIAYGLLSDKNYIFSLVGGVAYWMACLLAIHQIKLAVDRARPGTMHRTLLAFFAINAAISILVLLKIMIEARALNPYLYQGEYQKYFINTGDYIRGISFDTSSTNALINAFGVAYFISRRRAGMALLCMTVMLLTGSNATDILTFCVLLWLLFTGRGRERKSLALVCLFMGLVFTIKISPQNHQYVFSTVEKGFTNRPAEETNAGKPNVRITDMPDSLLDTDGRRMKIATRYVDSVSYLFWLKRDSIYKRLGVHWTDIHPRPRPNLDDPEFQSRLDTTLEMRKKLLEFIRMQSMEDQVAMAGEGYGRLPGKLIAFRQTTAFLGQHPGKWISGDGMGRYASKLAFRSTGLGMSGKYPAGIRYMNPDFISGHLALYLYYFTKGPELHSVLNTPDSVYDQILAEYGIAGLLIFLFFYFGYFFRQPGSAGIPLLFMMAVGFCLSYWFEQMSVVVIFELMMLIDRKESGTTAIKE